MGDVPPALRHEDKDDEDPNADDGWMHMHLEVEAPLSPEQPVHNPALDLFPDGGFVRLRSRAMDDQYVHANEDGDGLSLRPLGPVRTLNAVWRVHHCVLDEHNVYVLFQGAAYGRYITASNQAAPPGHSGHPVVQRDLPRHNVPEWDLAFKWSVEMAAADADHAYVCVRQIVHNLRANAGFLTQNSGVTAEHCLEDTSRISAMMQWEVEDVAASLAPIPLTPQATVSGFALPSASLQGTPIMAPIHEGHGRGMFWRRGTQSNPGPSRRIWHVRADDDGNFNQDHEEWPSFVFHGHSVFNLRTEVAHRQDDWNGDISFITLCAWPGYIGRLMPLVTDLPRSEEPMYIIVLTTGSPAAQALVYPQIHEPAA